MGALAAREGAAAGPPQAQQQRGPVSGEGGATGARAEEGESALQRGATNGAQQLRDLQLGGSSDAEAPCGGGPYQGVVGSPRSGAGGGGTPDQADARHPDGSWDPPLPPKTAFARKAKHADPLVGGA